MSSTLSLEELFDESFLQSLSHLNILAKRVAARGRPAEQRSKDLGTGIEFSDYRPYSHGDDLRGIDWNIYSRLGKLFLRIYEEHQDLPVYILPDCSKSMFLEDPPRIHTCLRVALALSSISLNQHDSVGLYPFSDQLDVLLRPIAGKSQLLRIAQCLSRIEAGGETRLAHSLKKFSAMGLRRGLVVVISDFFEVEGLEAMFKQLKGLRHRLLLVQLTRESDQNPLHSGDVEIEDCESGEVQNLSITPHCLQLYREAYESFQSQLLEFSHKRQAAFVRIDVEKDTIPQFAELFENGSLLI